MFVVESPRDPSINDVDLKRQAWGSLSLLLAKELLQGNSVEWYDSKTDLYFQYSHDVYTGDYYDSLGGDTPCSRFLKILQMKEPSEKDQDVLCIGKNGNLKKNALLAMLPTLKKNGYTDIEFVDSNGAVESLFNDDTATQRKKFRLVHRTGLSHTDMLTLNRISGDVVGATGDQSLIETLSAGKVAVYECLFHKRDLAKRYIQNVYEYTGNEKVKTLAELLFLKCSTAEELAQLETLMKDKETLQILMEANKNICKTQNLAKSISLQIAKRIAPKLLWEALKSRDFDKVNALIEFAQKHDPSILNTLNRKLPTGEIELFTILPGPELYTTLMSAIKQVSPKLDSPLDLKEDQLAEYVKIAYKLGGEQKVAAATSDIKDEVQLQGLLKTSRKDPDLKNRGLPFSILKFQDDKGFYLIDHGEAKIIGEGGWAKTKRGFYVDENGKLNPEPVAIKIDETYGKIPAAPRGTIT